MELKRRVLWIWKKFRMENRSLKVEKPSSVGYLRYYGKTPEASFLHAS